MTEYRDVVYRYGEQGTQDLRHKLNDLGAIGEKVGRQIGEGGKTGSAGLKAIDEAARQAKNVVDDFASRAGPAGAIIGQFGPIGIAAAAGIGAFTAAVGFAIREAAQAEREMAKLEGIIRAQGTTARVTGAEIDRYAESIAASTMAMESELKGAAAQLLAFRGVAGSTFEQVLVAAQDLAASGFGSLSTNAVALGKALNDPVNEAQALQKIFPALTDEVIKSVKATAEQNGVFAAQQELLAKIRDTIGGAGASEADTVIGAWHRLRHEMEQTAESGGGWFLRDIKSALQGAANKLRRARTGESDAVIDGQLYTNDEISQLLANTRAFLAASERDIEITRARGIEALQAYHAEQAEIEERAAAYRAASREKEQRESQALWKEALDFAERIARAGDRIGEKADSEIERSARNAKDLMARYREIREREEYEAGARLRTIYDEATRDIHRTIVDTIDDAFQGNLRSAEAVAGQIKNVFTRMFANIAAEQMQQQLLSRLGQSGMQNLAAGFAGYSLGSSLGNARGGPGNEIGGLIGGAAGSYFGPVGTFIGSAIGSLLGGQFGPRPSDQIEGVTRRFNPDGTISRSEQDLGPNKDSPQNRAAVNALDDAVMTFINGLKGFGLNPSGTWAYALEAGGGNSLSPFQAHVNNSGTRGFSTAEEAFQWVADQLVATIGEVPERLQALVDNFDPSNVEQFFNDLQRVQNFENTLVGVSDQLLKITDPEAWDIKQVTDWFKAMEEEAIALGYDVTSAIFKPVLDLRDAQLAGIAGRYHPTTPGGGVSAEPLQETANWLSIIGGLYDKRIDQLQDEAAALRDSAQAWERVGNALKQTRSGLLIDPNLSPLSLEARRAESFSQLEAMYQKAQGGDADAAAQLPDLARATLQASREFYRSSEDYYRDFERVQNILGAAQSYAAQQVDVAKQSLDVQVAILTTLQNQRGGLGGTGRPAFNTADVANITKEFQAAWQRSGLSRSDFLASDEGQSVWLPLRAQWIGGISDKDQLEASLAAARSQKSEGGYASSDAVLFEQQVTNRMRELGFDVPTMHAGGMVRRTGLVYAEQGEHITPRGGMSGLEKTVAMLAAQVADLTSVMAESGSRSLELLGEIADSNGALLQSDSMAAMNARLMGRGKVAR